MKKKFVIVLIIMIFVTVAYAANVKWTDKTELTAIDNADILLVVDDVSGTATSKKITVLNFFDTIDTFAELNSIVADKTLVNEEDAVTWDALGTFGLGITITTGDPFTLGVVRWDNGSDLIDGEQIAADTIDNDSIDWADMTDLTTDGAVSWGNIAEGELANSTVVSADIKDNDIAAADIGANAVQASELDVSDVSDDIAGDIAAGELTDDSVQADDIDTINCGTNCTWDATNDEIDVDDAFLANDGDTGTGTYDFIAATISMPKRTSNNNEHFAFNAWNPNSLYDTDTQICFEPNLPAAITITEVTVTCDADPTTELDWDLKWADAFIGLGNATLIVACDTTNGAADIDSGFNDATVAAGKCLYMEFGADPDSNIKQAMVKIRYDYD